MKNLLVLDDDSELRKVYRAVLKRQGFSVEAPVPTTDIKELIRETKPDLIVINHLMRGINGGELCLMVKNNPNTEHIPVIILTDYDNATPDTGVYDCDLFLPKSISFETFINQVKNLLKHKAPN
jgi:CheY-like chemotaxis protein